MASIFDTDPLPGRAINDTKSTRKAVFDTALSAAQSIKPVSNQTHTLELSDPHYVGPEEFSQAAHKAAIVNGTSLGRRLKATYTLRDNATGSVVAQKKRTLATIPYYTDSGTFVDTGTEYTLANQLRLKPGVYTRVKANSEVEAHCNPLPGGGVPHRIFLDPKSGIFRVTIGQAHMPLVPMLQSLGATDADIKQAWGVDLASVNLKKTTAADLPKLYARLVRKATATTPAEQRDQIRQALEATKLDAGSTEKTLGRPFTNVSLDSLLTTTRKLLAVHNRANPDVLQRLGLEPAEEDDRDNLAHMQLIGPEDVIAERIRGGSKLLNPILWRAARNQNLSGTTAGLLNRAVRGAFLDTGLGGVSEGINPGQLFDQQMRVTRMGTGGISSDAIPATARSVQGSHLGYIDPVLTPESLSAGVDSRLSYHIRKGANGEMYAPFSNAKTGQVEWKQPEDLYHAVIAFPGELEKAAETGDHTVYGMRRGRMGNFPAADVAYSVPTMEHAFSPLANIVPMKSGMKGQRVAMAARMSTQALPLINAEAPLVQSGIPGTDRSFESLYGTRMGAVRSEKSGQVVSVQPHQIGVRYDDGTSATIPLSQHRPNNRKTMFHQEPVVQAGQRFDSGSVLAKSNYTDASGTSSLGLNARVGYTVARGTNFEDAIALSESLAKRLSSQHLYQHPIEFTESTHKVGKRGWAGIFPGVYQKKQLEALDDDGVITPGRVVEFGDPLVLVANKRDRRIGAVSGARAGSFSDQTEVWTHHTPGIVTDVSKTNKGVNVAVHTVMPLQKGDKVSNRFGGKGVVGCYDDRTEILTQRGWVFFRDLLPSDTVASKHEDKWRFVTPKSVIWAPYDGPLLTCQHDRLDYAVTPNHRMFCRIENYRGVRAEYRIRRADQMHDKRVTHVAALPMEDCRGLLRVDLPQPTRRGLKQSLSSFDARTFCRFLGWYLAEGSLAYWKGRAGKKSKQVTSYKVQISQSRTANPEKCRSIETTLTSMGVRWHYSGCQYTFSSKVLWAYLSPLGLCDSKHVPREILENANQAELRDILFGLLRGDGHYGVSANTFTSTSKQLINDVEEIAARLGLATASSRKDHREFARHKPKWRTTVFFVRPEVGSGSAGSYGTRAYSGIVYCVDVGGEGLVLVRRNGKPFWCGNSVIPDDEMPVGEDGRPLELLLNPLGVISRGNPNQIVETVLGKIAARTGKPYIMPDFQRSTDLVKFAEQELAKHGMKDLEDLHDPVSGQTIPQILTGQTFLMKLHHTAESKEGGRAFGAYTQDGVPAKGGPDGAKTWGMLHLNALLSHGALGVIDDAHRIRGQRNTAYWAAVMSGRTPPDPPPSFVYDKFLNHLRGAGINPVRTGSSTHLMALTNKDIDRLAGDRAIQNADTVDWNHANLKPVLGGLFDEKIFGGAMGGRWGKIPLDEPMPNPVMEEPIRRVLGLKTAEFRDVLSGAKELHGQTGPQAIATALDRIDLPKELERVQNTIANGRKTARDVAIRKAGFLMGAVKTGVHPREWMWNSAPVLPPQFRPISKMSNGVPMVADANYLYRELFEAKKLAKQSLDSFGSNGAERLNLYDSLKAVAGLGDPVSDKLQQQEVKGLLSHIIGKSPKTGMMQKRLLGLRADLVGRATVIPNPNLDMDSIAIPENMAWSVYRPFVTRHLVQHGMTPMRAATAVADRHGAARNALLEVMKTRPVIVDRSPVWHRYGIMAFHPQLTTGHNIETNVVVNKGYGLDHDGDAMQVHVPATDQAVKDAYDRMLPSKNLLDVATFKPHMVPSQEFLGGLYAASTGKSSNRPVQFATKLEALRAFWRGDIGADQEVHILNERD